MVTARSHSSHSEQSAKPTPSVLPINSAAKPVASTKRSASKRAPDAVLTAAMSPFARRATPTMLSKWWRTPRSVEKSASSWAKRWASR